MSTFQFRPCLVKFQNVNFRTYLVKLAKWCDAVTKAWHKLERGGQCVLSLSHVWIFSSGPTDETGERRRGCFPCRTLSAMPASQQGPHLASNSAVWLARPSTFSCFWPKTELAFVFLRIDLILPLFNVQLLCLFTWGPLFQRNRLKLIYQCPSPTNLAVSRVHLILTILSKVDRT